MITELTKEQEARLPEYRDKWLKIGLSTDPGNEADAEKLVDAAYEVAGLKAPKDKIWRDSPWGGAKVAAILSKVESVPKDLIEREAKLEASEIRSQLNQCGYGQHDAHWLGFYNFFLEVMDLKVCERLKPLMDLANHIGWWWPFDKAAVLTRKPQVLNMQNQRLHCDGGPAMKYADGFAVWALNGVRVPKDVAETPGDKMDTKILLTTSNAEVKREIVRKIGVDRIYSTLGGETLDTWKDYDLVLLNLGDGRKRPYLKMKNPSIGVFHIEGVHPDCKTVKDALAWRNGMESFTPPQVLT